MNFFKCDLGQILTIFEAALIFKFTEEFMQPWNNPFRG